MGSPVKSRNVHLFPDFSGKRHAKTRHVMGSHGISRHSNGKVRTKGGFNCTNNTVYSLFFLETKKCENLTLIIMEILKTFPPIKAKIQFTKFNLEIPG